MRNLNPLLIITAVGFLFSSFSYNNEKKPLTENENLYSIENSMFLENKYFEVYSEDTPVVNSLNNVSILQTQNNISDSITSQSKDVKKNQYVLSTQYDKLQKVLKKYQTIEKNNQWTKIDIDSVNFKSLKPVDNHEVIKQIRNRLFVVGDLKQDSKSELYDEELMAGVLNYKKRHGLALNYELTLEHINQMNEPISNRIKSIELNMERCRQMPLDQANATEYIMVNIPSYRLSYIKNGNNVFVSDVFVGAKWTKTEVFSSVMNKVVFSPYWNIPQSIVDNEIKKKIFVDKDYLEKNDMEYNEGRIRQKPGMKNSLGLVKFLFPNPYDIYMHDTPAKSLFLLEKRTFSHGCINIKDAKGLAETILKNDTNWDIEKIENAMNCGIEIPYELKNKIPVYVGYYTAWVSEDTGEINFYEDIYNKDTNPEPLQNINSIVMD